MTPARRRALIISIAALVVLAVVLILVLSQCGAKAAPSPSASSSGSPSASASAVPSDDADAPDAAEIPADAVLIVRATVTADNGAVLDLVETVYRSTSWDDPAASDRPALMTAVCAGALDEGVYAANGWSFARVEIAANPRAGTPDWPGSPSVELQKWIGVRPFTTHLSVAGEGAVVEDPTADPASPHCKRDLFLTGPGEATLAVGFGLDTDNASPFTRWASHAYGFHGTFVSGVSAASAGVTMSDCVVTVTPLGLTLGGAQSDSVLSDDTRCVAQSSTPENTDS